MTLVDVEQFLVPPEIVEETEEALKRAGSEGYELFVVWSGVQNGTLFEVRTPHVPHQTSYRLSSGLCVRVEGQELHRLNVWLYEAGETLAIQVHAHPTEAYHSDTDDAYPIVAALGSVSIVTPDFCRNGLFTNGTAVYRLERKGWIKQPNGCIKVT